MTTSYIGIHVNDLFFSFIHLLTSMNLYVIFRLTVGPKPTYGLVLNFIPFFEVGSLWTSKWFVLKFVSEVVPGGDSNQDICILS